MAAGDFVAAAAASQAALKAFDAENTGDTALGATILYDLGLSLVRLKRLAPAEQALRRGATLAAQAFGERGPESARISRDLAALLAQRGSYPSAADYYERSLAYYSAPDRRAGTEYADISLAYAGALLELDRSADALRILQQALDAQAGSPPRDGERVRSLRLGLVDALLAANAIEAAEETLALARQAMPTEAKARKGAEDRILYAQILVTIERGALREAETLLDRLAQRLPEHDPSGGLLSANVTYLRSYVLIMRGQFVVAEPLLRQAIDLYKARTDADHPIQARALHSLAIVYEELGDFDRAREFFDRALTIKRRSLGNGSAQVIATVIEQAQLDLRAGRVAEAEATARSIIRTMTARRDANQQSFGLAHVILGIALARQEGSAAAIDTLQAATRILSTARGEEAPELDLSYIELGSLYLKTKNLVQADAAIGRAIAILRRHGSTSPSKLPRALAVRAEIKRQSGNRLGALEDLREAAATVRVRSGIGGSVSDLSEREQRSARDIYVRLVDLLEAQPAAGGAQAGISEAFEAAQAAQISTASRAIALMTARFSQRSGLLSDRVRQQQDAVTEWRAVDRRLTELLVRPTGGSDGNLEMRLRARRDLLTSQLTELDRRFAAEFPAYMELTAPRPMSIAGIQSLLRSDEALILHLSAAEESFVFAVGRSFAVLRRVPVSADKFTALVTRLREAVDATSIAPGSAPSFEEFDAALALYDALLRPIEADIAGARHLVTVVDGPMQSIPLGMLLTRFVAPKDRSDLASAPWLARSFALSTLPTVSSFAALRQTSRPSTAPRPFLGIGDPILGAKRGSRRSATPGTQPGQRHRVDVEWIRSLEPLPETADELRTIATWLKDDTAELLLRDRARKPIIREMPLKDFRVIAFATHAIVAGTLRGVGEPAIILTPPAQYSERDNGLLTSSDIAMMQLDADWVLLSACNTASPDGQPDADGFSGLAQAFFYAGARGMLVSHWSVESTAAARLTTGMFAALGKDSTIGKAEALRRSIVALMEDRQSSHMAHPLFWAPFVLVGDGG